MSRPRPTPTCRCDAIDPEGHLCGKFYDPRYGGRCACGAFNWTETAPRPQARKPVGVLAPPRDDASDEEAWLATRERGPCATCGVPERQHDVRGCGCYERPRPRARLDVPRPIVPANDVPDHVRILRAEDGDNLVVTQYPAILSKVIGGLAEGKVHAILGAAGAGKSTIAAEAAAAIAGRHGAPIWWLDGDQNSMALVNQVFALAKADRTWLRVPSTPDPASFTWPQAFALVPQDALVMVVDSLETWAPRSDQARGEMLRALRLHGCRFKLVIAAADENDKVTGAGALERAWDASVFVHKRAIHTGKCRWSRESEWSRYSAEKRGVRLLVRRIEDPDDDFEPDEHVSDDAGEDVSDEADDDVSDAGELASSERPPRAPRANAARDRWRRHHPRR